MTTSALGDLCVLDCSTTVAAAWCGRLLADFGADVVALEGSDNPLRDLAPFDTEGRSILGRYVQANKRSLAIDREHTDAAGLVARMLDHADIVVLSEAPERLVERGVERGSVERAALLRVAVTPHGLSGPLADAPGNDLTHWARSGWASINGLADGPPAARRGGDGVDHDRRHGLWSRAGGAASARAEREGRHRRRGGARRRRGA